MEFRYLGLRAVLETVTVKDADVDQQMLRLQQQTPRYTPVEGRAAQNGDELVLDYAGFVGEEQFAGGTAQMQTLVLGSNTFIPGFEEQLVGANVGDDVDVKVTFPQQYHAAELAGKEAVFHCHVHAIRTRSSYELDDTFAKEVGQCETLDEMKKQMKQAMQAYADDAAEQELRERLLRQAAATFTVFMTEEKINTAVDEQLETMQAQLAQRGLTLEAYCQFTNSSMAKLREDIRPEAENALKIKEMVRDIARTENLTASQEDLEAAKQEIARVNGMSIQDLTPYLDEKFLSAVTDSILMAKVTKLIRDNAKIEVQPAR